MEETFQNAEFDTLLAYDSSEDFSDTDSVSDDVCNENIVEEVENTDKSDISELYVGKTFQSWDHVANFMKKFATAKGHGVRIGGGGKVDKAANEVLKRTYLCRHAGKAKSNRQKGPSNASSCRVECLWKVNIWVKKSKGYLEVTKFNDQHIGHECHPSASQFVPTLRKLPEEILEEIRFLTVIAKVNATVQYRIIREKFKTRIYRPDLYNAISKFRRESTPGEEDTGMLLKRLHDKKTEDPRWIISMKFDPITSSLTHLFWMSPEQQILWLRWDALLQNYPQSKDYLTKVLGCNPQSWARTFTNRYFTAGIQTTSRNEGENSTLKRLFGDSNLSLSELFDALEERYQEENDYCEFVNWKQTVPQIGSQNVAKSIFRPVVKQLNEFTMPNVIKKQEEQMNLSLCYHATEIDIENARSKEKVLDESDKCIDNLFDCLQVYLSSFLENTSVILEIWEILHLANPQTSHFIYLLNDNTFLCTCMMFKTHGYPCRHFYRIMTLTPTARFHIGLVNQRWYKEALQGTDISDNEFVVISLNALASKNHTLPTQFLRPSNSDVNQIGEFGTSADNYEISKVISKKRKFGELFGLGKKIMVDIIEEDDKDTYYEVLEFFQSIQQKRSQIIVGDNSSGDYNNGNLPEIQSNNGIMEIRNPIVRKSKGRPKSKRVKGILEESNNTKTQYKCKNCKQIGHNSKTCKGKENQGVGC
ncbi:unnamed protein product [Rhizophagus irregularis]|nr:unnamed protein product [Rhizophagus irregularis]